MELNKGCKYVVFAREAHSGSSLFYLSEFNRRKHFTTYKNPIKHKNKYLSSPLSNFYLFYHMSRQGIQYLFVYNLLNRFLKPVYKQRDTRNTNIWLIKKMFAVKDFKMKSTQTYTKKIRYSEENISVRCYCSFLIFKLILEHSESRFLGVFHYIIHHLYLTADLKTNKLIKKFTITLLPELNTNVDRRLKKERRHCRYMDLSRFT
jgi:hypothetical protein